MMMQPHAQRRGGARSMGVAYSRPPPAPNSVEAKINLPPMLPGMLACCLGDIQPTISVPSSVPQVTPDEFNMYLRQPICDIAMRVLRLHKRISISCSVGGMLLFIGGGALIGAGNAIASEEWMNAPFGTPRKVPLEFIVPGAIMIALGFLSFIFGGMLLRLCCPVSMTAEINKMFKNGPTGTFFGSRGISVEYVQEDCPLYGLSIGAIMANAMMMNPANAFAGANGVARNAYNTSNGQQFTRAGTFRLCMVRLKYSSGVQVPAITLPTQYIVPGTLTPADLPPCPDQGKGWVFEVLPQSEVQAVAGLGTTIPMAMPVGMPGMVPGMMPGMMPQGMPAYPNPAAAPYYPAVGANKY